ncbi:MAG: hypothetical protein GC162_03515 [Planctomycetes bacterium]|nr:hypothetical protein [Planctomycetota bacterium]
MTHFESPFALWCMRHLTNGDAFYLAMALLIIAGFIRIAGSWRAMYRYRRIAAACGALGAFFTIIAAGSMTVMWLFFLGFMSLAASLSRHHRRARGWLMAPMIFFGLCAVVDDLRYERGPMLDNVDPAAVIVLSDALSVDLPAGDDTGGATRRRVASLDFTNAKLRAVLTELRGSISPLDETFLYMVGTNDMLALAGPMGYLNDARALTGWLSADNRVVIVDLPVPPRAPWYGWTLRSLARLQHLPIIPKRVVADVIYTPGNTTDGLHLSPAGQAALNQRIAAYFRADR